MSTPVSTSNSVWFITGSTSGFGKAIALEALSRGHKVIATARNAAKLADLEAAGADVMSLDVTASLEELKSKAAEAHAKYGRVTHLINAAGYILEGAIEETTPEESQDTFNTNVFGTLNVVRAFLPYLRAQHSSVIANFGSIASWGGGPAFGLYAATKWAVSGLTESLRAEVEAFGIKVTVIEPGYFRTNFLNPGARVKSSVQLAAYEESAVGQVRKMLDAVNNNQAGDVKKGAKVIVDVLTETGVAEGKGIPIRLVLGSDGDQIIRGKCESTEALLTEWKDIMYSTDYPKGE
ncbi:NAD(P)-binding protein [Mytilinidion resinicola]|uniref:NAD(P)-binding protein n=1 Tax=Mytilinidion resinicola TaxID=574789 RepID=A0A6A6YJ11_9PEZI|nr:NAD(P)-binding protein [Mytilinidion resinicola]KAF2808842.1 NAD(P)-binding protein [Mytilinidion resinicola]